MALPLHAQLHSFADFQRDIQPSTWQPQTLIARIYPVLNNQAGQTFLHDNPKRLLAALPLPDDPVRALRRGEREPTQPLDNSLGDSDDYLDCLELRFSNPPKTDRGFVFGRDEKCDVVLPANLKNISNYHFSLTFENNFEDTHRYRLVLRDLRSTFGTSVEYNGKGGGHRRDFRWILSGHSETLNTPIIIQPHCMLLLRIVVFVPRISGHLDGCVRHLLRQRSPESLFNDLNLNNPPQTEAATGIQSPTSGAILIDTAEFGRGAFAVVYRCWNVSTGRLFPRKKSRYPLAKKELNSWRREAKLLAELSHVRGFLFCVCFVFVHIVLRLSPILPLFYPLPPLSPLSPLSLPLSAFPPFLSHLHFPSFLLPLFRPISHHFLPFIPPHSLHFSPLIPHG